MNNLKNNQSGFTLIEILVVIGMIALLAAIVIIAINPSRQFAQGRNTDRNSAANTLLNAIGQRLADNKGNFNGGTPNCPPLTVDTVYTIAKNSGTFVAPATAVIDLSCLTPTYIPTALPYDPSGTGLWTDAATYNTNYNVKVDNNGRYTVSAPNAELGQTIAVTR